MVLFFAKSNSSSNGCKKTSSRCDNNVVKLKRHFSCREVLAATTYVEKKKNVS